MSLQKGNWCRFIFPREIEGNWCRFIFPCSSEGKLVSLQGKLVSLHISVLIEREIGVASYFRREIGVAGNWCRFRREIGVASYFRAHRKVNRCRFRREMVSLHISVAHRKVKRHHILASKSEATPYSRSSKSEATPCSHILAHRKVKRHHFLVWTERSTPLAGRRATKRLIPPKWTRTTRIPTSGPRLPAFPTLGRSGRGHRG